jgi:hypothetical protein
MSERNINIDDLFKDALKDFEVPSPLRSKTKKKDSFVKKNTVLLVVGAIAAMGVASFLLLTSKEQVAQPTIQTVAPIVKAAIAPVVKEIVVDTVVKVVEVPKTIVVEAPKAKTKNEPEKVAVPVYTENSGEKSMIITTRSSYSETYEVDEKGNKIKVLSTQSTRRSDTTLVK